MRRCLIRGFRGNLAHTGEYPRSTTTIKGILKWKFKTENDIFSSPAVVEQIGYIGDYDGYVYGIE